jgi:type II restriction enzyme
MRTGFEEIQAAFNSGSRRARVWTEGWVAREAYCINCGNPKIENATNKSPVLTSSAHRIGPNGERGFD